MSTSTKYRSRSMPGSLVAFSMSYDRENLLSRGMGLEHLKDLLRRLATPMLRQNANLAYGGNWVENDENLTYSLLRIINAEQEDNSLGGPDTSYKIGKLYNHLAWPYYLDVTPKIEAQWINCCRIVRITQQQAGIDPAFVVPDADANNGSPRSLFNKAVTLTAMRRLTMNRISIPIPSSPFPETVPSVVARIVLGGKLAKYSGFLPGLFEEALFTLRNNRPLFILGGFGGAAEVLANAILDPDFLANAPDLTLDGLARRNPDLATLQQAAQAEPKPSGFEGPAAMLGDLVRFLKAAQATPAATLNSGLSDDDTRKLLKTNDVPTAVKLVRDGLTNTQKLLSLPA